MKDTTHILIVDDDRRIRDMLCRYLEPEGFDVTAVEDGDAMRLHVSGNRVDLVLLDLVLGGHGLAEATLVFVAVEVVFALPVAVGARNLADVIGCQLSN